MQFYVKDIMTIDPLTIKQNVTIRDAVKIFSANDISGLPVIDQDNEVIGVITATDIIENESSNAFFSSDYIKNIKFDDLRDAKFFNHQVSTIMSKNLFTTTPDANIAQMAKIMYENRIHRLLVTEYNKLVGIVTTFDVLKLLATSDESVLL